MSLDLGAIVARATIDDRPFQVKYGRLVRQMGEIGRAGERAGVGTSALDRSLTQTAVAASEADAAMGRATREIRQAGLSASSATAATQAYKSVLTEAGVASSKLTQAQLRQQAAIERMVALQESGTASTRQLASAQASLIAATDRVAVAEERAGKAAGFQSEAWHSAGRAATVTGLVITAGFVMAGKAAAGFDAKMALVRTLARATPPEMEQLRDAALHVGQAYGYSANQVADAEAELVKAGISVKDILGGALRGALTLAAAGQEDVASATETAAFAMTQFGLTARDVPHIADLLAAGADKALGSVADLSQALKYGGLAASQAGWSIEQTVGTLAELAQAGQMGSRAGQSMQMMLRNLQHPSQAAAGVMKQYGIEVYDANGHMIDSTRLAGELHDTLGKLPDAERQAALATLFNANAVRSATILMQGGADANREWIKGVNDQAFAALQAAGKMDSLSGDVTKLHAALTEAIIGTGEDAQGPLRGLVQDVTKVVQAWNEMPGPMRQVVEELGLVTGAVTLLGGAAVLFIPKWAAMNEALAQTRFGAISATGALKNLGRMTVVAGVVYGLYEGAKALGNVLAENSTPSVNDFTQALVDLDHGATGANNALLGYITRLGALAGTDAGTMLPALTKNLDAALASLVTSGHLDTAQSDFDILSAKLRAAGMSTAAINRLFPQFASALSDSATQAKVAGTGVDDYGNAVTKSAKATKEATDAAKAYADRLHALADPLFAMNQALEDLRAKQKAATEAVKKHGEESKAAKQAQLDLASSSLDVEAAAAALKASVDDGTTSLGKSKQMLRDWVRDGLVTKSQADAIRQSFKGIIDTADKIGPSLHTSGKNAGGDYVEGVIQGIDAKLGRLQAEADRMGGVVDTTVRKKHKSQSPSKVAEKTGKDYGDGLAKGLTDSEQHIADAATRMAQKAVDAARSALQDVRSTLHADLGSRRSTASGIVSNLMGPLDLSNAVINGRTGDLRGFFTQGIRPLRHLTHEERLLRDAGLSPKLLAQIAGMQNPMDAIAVASNILSGRSGSVGHLNHLFGEARHYAKATGGLVAGELYDPRIADDRKAVQESVKELREMNATLREVKRVIKDNPADFAAALDRIVAGLDHKRRAHAGH